jgi:hypothetical protein
MPIDASIYQNIKPFQMESPENYLAKILNLQDAQQQQQMNRMKMQEYERGVSEESQMRDLTKQSGGDMNKLRELLYNAGNFKQGSAVDASITKQKKDASEGMKAQYEAEFKKFDLAAQIMNGVVDQASYSRARQQTAQVFGQEAAAKMPEVYDPNLIAENQAKAISIKDRLENQYKQLTLEETKANNLRQDSRARDGQGIAIRGQNITAQGQQLTDSRAREFNATKEEENNIRRDEKDATSKLTKESQIASFDTMLGTLDRLAQHPGLKNSVGLRGALPTAPGSNAANFQAELNTFQSQAFLPMVAQLKGMGALSDAEGKKLSAAVGALDPKMGEQAFRDSIARITADMDAARARMTNGTKVQRPGALPTKNDATSLEAEMRRRGLLK